ncbi:hypothetical protein FHT77_000456 [Rhizobium sp. BK181]|nr:hypothetical protein [Rhizobium sp. BK181]
MPSSSASWLFSWSRWAIVSLAIEERGEQLMDKLEM